jgi:hypothetical protein
MQITRSVDERCGSGFGNANRYIHALRVQCGERLAALSLCHPIARAVRAEAGVLAEKAHDLRPYSNATRDDVAVPGLRLRTLSMRSDLRGKSHVSQTHPITPI